MNENCQAGDLTSVPVNGWIVVKTSNLAKADGYVVLKTTESKVENLNVEVAWHFCVVNVDGQNDGIATNRLGDAIVEFVELITGQKAVSVHFNDSVADKLVLGSTFWPSS